MLVKKVLIRRDIIEECVKQLASQINSDYRGQEVTFICILKGSMYFFTDLTKEIDLETNVELIRVSSYEGEKSTGKVKLIMGLDNPINDKNVIVVEDIVDTGCTLSYLMEYLTSLNPKSLRICSLLSKPDRREVPDLDISYLGFSIPNRFVIGYGLDMDGKYRNLPEIYCFVDENEDEELLERDIEGINKQLIKKMSIK